MFIVFGDRLLKKKKISMFRTVVVDSPLHTTAVARVASIKCIIKKNEPHQKTKYTPRHFRNEPFDHFEFHGEVRLEGQQKGHF